MRENVLNSGLKISSFSYSVSIGIKLGFKILKLLKPSLYRTERELGHM